MKQTYSLKEAEVLTGIAANTLRQWLNRGDLVGLKVAIGKKEVWHLTFEAIERLRYKECVTTGSYIALIESWQKAMRQGLGYQKPISKRTIELHTYSMQYYWKWLQDEPSLAKIDFKLLEKALSSVEVTDETCHYTLRMQVYDAISSF